MYQAGILPRPLKKKWVHKAPVISFIIPPLVHLHLHPQYRRIIQEKISTVCLLLELITQGGGTPILPEDLGWLNHYPILTKAEIQYGLLQDRDGNCKTNKIEKTKLEEQKKK